MAFSSINTIAAFNNNKTTQVSLLNYFYPFTNSSDLNNGYILNYSTNLYDLSAVNITSSNFYANGMYFPNSTPSGSPGSYCINSSVIVNTQFTIIQKYNINTWGSSRRLFTLRTAANLSGINIRLATSGILTSQQTKAAGTLQSSVSFSTNNSDTLVCIYSPNNYTVYTNANSAGTSLGSPETSISYKTNMIIVIGTLLQTSIVANNNFSNADTNQLISSFRFYNRALTPSEITGALSGTYPSS